MIYRHGEHAFIMKHNYLSQNVLISILDYNISTLLLVFLGHSIWASMQHYNISAQLWLATFCKRFPNQNFQWNEATIAELAIVKKIEQISSDLTGYKSHTSWDFTLHLVLHINTSQFTETTFGKCR